MLRVRKQIKCSDELIASCGTKGITIAMLDTGIFEHPDFDNRIIAFKDFVNEKHVSYDDNGHGTHVAGILGGSGFLSRKNCRRMPPMTCAKANWRTPALSAGTKSSTTFSSTGWM